MVAHVLWHQNIVYIDSTLIPPLTSENLFWFVYKDFALYLTEQGLDFINHKNMFKLKCLKVKWLVSQFQTEEDLWIDNKGESFVFGLFLSYLISFPTSDDSGVSFFLYL